MVQTQETTSFITAYTDLGPNEQLNIFGMFCEIEYGSKNIGDVDEDGTEEFTYTDITELYVPNRNQIHRALPLCCNPRNGPGEFLFLELWRSNFKLLRGHQIPLAMFNNKNLPTSDPINDCDDENMPCKGHSKELLFTEPITIYPSETFRFRVVNSNLVDEDTDTYSVVNISFICEIVDKKETLELLGGE